MEDISELKVILHQEGLRYTSQREAIWQELLANDSHRDAEEVYVALRQKGLAVSRATVYRTVDVLVRNQLIRALDIGDGKIRYQNRLDSQHHDHMVCTECGEIFEFVNHEIEVLQDKIAAQRGFKIQRHSHHLYGICAQCQNN